MRIGFLLSTILLTLCFFQMVPYSQAGPIDWVDKKAGEYVTDTLLTCAVS